MNSSSEASAFPLAMAGENATVRVIAILGGAGLARRVTEMGLNVGCELTVLQRQNAGLVVTRGETRFALGDGVAHKIMVCEIRSEPEITT